MIRGLGRLHLPGVGPLAAVIEESTVRPLPGRSLADLLSAAEDAGALRAGIDRAAAESAAPIPMEELAPAPDPDRPHLLAPVDRQECWGAGCTYLQNDEALGRMRADRPLYADTYEADRPMLFFKGVASVVSGPGAPICCRPGSAQTIPEAELTVLLGPTGVVLGFTLGNDVTALDLERRNPLYQPQAKVFAGSAALGPWWILADAVPDIPNRTLSCEVTRGGRRVLEQRIDPSRLVRRLDELSGWLFEAADFPAGVVLMTGGGAAVPEGFALEPGDEVLIAHPNLGVLHNPVDRPRRPSHLPGRG
ncbi:fumarylacetoacetate hydrolase family protein (plasmid) [Tundrisphaera lichenicola]|uniref:fumarylacetoacetate hydrolase family protein n=1 Tax=Tundrisphaera lichenicola TaxID=2029860 RepID=UPI003EB7D755